MTNVVKFPGKMVTMNSSSDDDELSEEVKRDLANMFAEKQWAKLLKQFIVSGQDIDKDESFPSAILILESIRSLHLQSQGIHHPLQDFARDSIFVEDFEDDEITVDNDEDMD